MTGRQKRIMAEEGKRIEKIDQLSVECLKGLKEEGVTLGEAKVVIEQMAHILTESERYRPETLLSDVPLKF